jgi:hypothetical protein
MTIVPDSDTATQYSDGTHDSEKKSVSFDIRPSSKPVQEQSERAASKARKFRKIALTNFQIESSGIRITGRYGVEGDGSPAKRKKSRTAWAEPARLHNLAVDLHFRNYGTDTRKPILHEVSALLLCRHPHVLFILGYVLDFPDGPALVTERSWGNVSAVLRQGPLSTALAISIATQIASALRFLHDRNILHNNVAIRNVLLLGTPDSHEANAKLANFSRAELDVGDAKVLAKDCRAFGVLIYNLFVNDLSDCVMPGESVSPNQILKFQVGRGLDDLGVLSQSLSCGKVFLASEVDERLTVMHEQLQNPQMMPSPSLQMSSDPEIVFTQQRDHERDQKSGESGSRSSSGERVL